MTVGGPFVDTPRVQVTGGRKPPRWNLWPPASARGFRHFALQLKTAPIFFSRTRGTNVWLRQRKEDVPCHFPLGGNIPQGAKHGCDEARGRRGQQPPPDVTGCLDEVQASNPAFPARAAFSNLEGKSRAPCSGNRKLFFYFYHCTFSFRPLAHKYSAMLYVCLSRSTFPAHQPDIQSPTEPFGTREPRAAPQTVPDRWPLCCWCR